MGSPKDIIIMVLLIAAVIALTAFIEHLHIGKHFDNAKNGASSKIRSEERSLAMQSFMIGAIAVGAGVLLLMILKLSGVLDHTFFPYVKI